MMRMRPLYLLHLILNLNGESFAIVSNFISAVIDDTDL